MKTLRRMWQVLLWKVARHYVSGTVGNVQVIPPTLKGD